MPAIYALKTKKRPGLFPRDVIVSVAGGCAFVGGRWGKEGSVRFSCHGQKNFYITKRLTNW